MRFWAFKSDRNAKRTCEFFRVATQFGAFVYEDSYTTADGSKSYSDSASQAPQKTTYSPCCYKM